MQLPHVLMPYFTKKTLIVACLFIIYIQGMAQTTIQMEESGGVYKIPCTINGLKLKMIFDPGASNVCLSETVALMMIENDYLSIDDIKGTSQSQVADGRFVDNTIITLKEIKIGDKTLTNVDAVVVHGQNAPLLFGQAALRKLGFYSISGNRLTIGIEKNSLMDKKGHKKALYDILIKDYDLGSFEQFAQDVEDDVKRKKLYNAIKDEYDISDYEEFSQYLMGNDLSEEEIDQLFIDASTAYSEEAYSVAIEKYELLQNNNLLSAMGIMNLADSYYYTDRKVQALQTYLTAKTEIESNFPDYTLPLYYQIGRCYWSIKDYDSAIQYIQKVKINASPWGELQYHAVNVLSLIYIEIDDYYRARKIIDEYISQYLTYMDIKATDCWSKKYVDAFLASLYSMRAMCYHDYTDDVEKYNIISAAWGDKKSIEYCKKFNLDYTKKPYNYEY